MELLLQRNKPDAVATQGTLTVDGVFQCFTLERIPPVSIAAGRYLVQVTYSPDFKRAMPLIVVPGRAGIRIHWGNYSYDSEGCVLTGTKLDGSDIVDLSVAAFDALFPKLQAAYPSEEIWITVVDAPTALVAPAPTLAPAPAEHGTSNKENS